MLKRLKGKLRRTPKRATNNPVRVVVGLRNPGPDYEGTRHNIGSEVVLRVVDIAGEAFKKGPSRVRGLVAQSGTGPDRTLFLLPNTFMNESGAPVQSMLHYLHVGSADLLVVHDDIDLAFGRLRLQVAGGSGGHNGIRSIERALGTKEFSRLKIGVGRPPGSQDPAEYVLRPFTKKERPEVDVIVMDAADVVAQWMDDRVKAQEMATLRGKDV